MSKVKERFPFDLLFLLTLAVGLCYLSYLILKPFLTPIAWAAVLTIVFYPLNDYLVRRFKNALLAASVSLAVVMLLIVGPFFSLGFVLVSDLSSFAASMQEAKGKTVQEILRAPVISGVMKQVEAVTGKDEVWFEAKLIENLQTIATTVAGKASAGLMNIMSFVANFVLMALTSFFLFMDGRKFVVRAGDYLPLTKAQRELLGRLTRDIIFSTMYGGVVVALAQGLVGGVTYALLGLPSPVLWGAAIAIMSFVPMVGTAIVWVPMAAFLLFTGSYVQAIILIIVGVGVIGLMDNVLKTMIIGSRTTLPTLVIFFSALGGIKFMGMIGLILGPLVFALFFAVCEMLKCQGACDSDSESVS